MKKGLYIFSITLIFLCVFSMSSLAQIAEWRLVNPVYNSTDPDGAGPATSSVNFTFQIHAVSGSINNISAITMGWSWQSANAMIPTTTNGNGPGTGISAPGCTTPVNTPANVVMSPAFAAAGFLFNTVNECFQNIQTVGGQTYDRTVIGTLESSSSINLTTTWVDVFTITLWARNLTNPRAGYVITNSTASGSPGPFSNYELSDILANAIQANSMTYNTPLAIPPVTLPVQLTKFNVDCQSNKSTSVTWVTGQEINNNYFEVEKSVDGTNWRAISKVSGDGSINGRSYQVNDIEGGAAQYRLKQVDRDGKITYSSIVRSTCEGKNVYVTLYPVPARDVVNLIIGSDKVVKTSLQVLDMKGKIVLTIPATITTGTNNFKVPVHNLAAGEYIIMSTDNGIQINKRFTVAR